MPRAVLLALLLAACAAPGVNEPPPSSPIPPTNEIRVDIYEGLTPGTVQGARTISVAGLQTLLASAHPVLIDVLDGVSTSLPGAAYLPGAGMGTSLTDTVQRRLAAKLAALTGGDKARPVVFFCVSATCWLSHNAVVRAVAAGYTNVYWFRGGRNAWLEAGQPVVPVTAQAW